MSGAESMQAVSALGLDIGTSRIVVARPTEDGVSHSAELNCFVSVPYSKLTERILRKEYVPHRVCGREILVYGNESQKFALNREVRRPMRNGVLNPSEKNSLAHIRVILESLLKAYETSNCKLVFSIPAPPLGSASGIDFHEAAIQQILEDMGFQARSIPEGLAVIFSELEDTNYTGIGISCGGGMCNVCLAYLSVPIVQYSLPQAGDFIDESVASVTGESVRRVQLYKERSFYLNGFVPDQLHQALSVYYAEVIQRLAQSLEQALGTETNLPPLDRPIPLVISGGSSLPRGFTEEFQKAITQLKLPVQIAEIRRAREPLYATAQGALIAALSDS